MDLPKKSKRCFYWSLIILAAFYFGQGIYLPKSFQPSPENIFEVQKGDSAKDIADKLKAEGLIKSATLFRLYAATKEAAATLKPGTYSFSSSMSTKEIADKIAAGESLKKKITIVEGWNLKDIGSYLESQGYFQAEEFLKASQGLEGYIFPDTYQIGFEESIDALIKAAQNNFDKKVNNDIKQEIARQGKIVSDIVTMASLIEKEVHDSQDRRVVSGILWKRLEMGIPLQVDATITYITGKKTTKISKEETQIDSLYNTYKYAGLPAGSISNPGIDSILAAIYPEESEYWYYLSTAEGKTIFSKTLEEHNYAKSKYLR